MSARNQEIRNRVVWEIVWLYIKLYRATILWMVSGFVLLSVDYPRNELLGLRSGFVLMLVLWAFVASLSLLQWEPEYEEWAVLLPRGDWQRSQLFWRETKQHREGYWAARDLGLVLEVDWKSRAKVEPANWLPDARLLREPASKVVLRSVQEVGATNGQILDRAEAYAPVVGSSPEWTRFKRRSPDTVEITWWLRAPDDALSEVIQYKTHWANQSHQPRIDPMSPVAIGMREDGSEHFLQVFGRQILVVGSSGSGKGSLLWSIVLQLAPAIREGTVRLYGVDLKGGVELALGTVLFARIAYDFVGAISVLEEVKQLTDERLAWMRQNGLRVFDAPTPEHPLVLLILDEAGSLVYQAPDAKTKSRADELLRALASTGRAPGVAVIAALQDPRKESLASRDLFLDTLALRMKKSEVALALPPGAYDAGARTDRIPVTQPGTGYAVNNETGQIARFRAFWVPDEVIEEVAAIQENNRKDA